jgi:hypothetical protein
MPLLYLPVICFGIIAGKEYRGVSRFAKEKSENISKMTKITQMTEITAKHDQKSSLKI